MGWAEDNDMDTFDESESELWMPTAKNKYMDTTKTILSPERTYVAGVSYSDYQQLKTFKIGTELTLKWERSNSEDPRAISIYYKDIKIGYIPRVRTKNDGYADSVGIKARMWNLRDCGYKTRAILTSYRPLAAKAWEIFTIEVQFSDPMKITRTTNDTSDIKF